MHTTTYDLYKSEGKQVYLIDQVVSFLETNYPDINPPKTETHAPKFESQVTRKNTTISDDSLSKEILDYLDSCKIFIDEEVKKRHKNTDVARFGFMLKSKKREKYAMIYFIIAIKMGSPYANVYLTLAKIFKKFNLQREAIEVCKLCLSNPNIKKGIDLIKVEEYYKLLIN